MTVDSSPATALDTRVVSVLEAADLPSVPTGVLEPDQLADWVRALVARPDLWRRYVAHDTEGRHYVSLYRDTHIDVWLLCWNVVDDTGWHDHDISSGAVAVTQGVVAETRPRMDGGPDERDLHAGDVVCFGPDYIHRMVGGVDASVSIHVYSPPLWRMGQYSVDENGMLHRHSLSYADELRPLS